MQQLLESEGVKVIDNQIQDLDRILWNPTTELSQGDD
jgi:methylated-DNA-protein-cysteine methyltransferase-like protein